MQEVLPCCSLVCICMWTSALFCLNDCFEKGGRAHTTSSIFPEARIMCVCHLNIGRLGNNLDKSQTSLAKSISGTIHQPLLKETMTFLWCWEKKVNGEWWGLGTNHSLAHLERPLEQVGSDPASESYDWKERPSTFPVWEFILHIVRHLPPSLPQPHLHTVRALLWHKLLKMLQM